MICRLPNRTSKSIDKMCSTFYRFQITRDGKVHFQDYRTFVCNVYRATGGRKTKPICSGIAVH